MEPEADHDFFARVNRPIGVAAINFPSPGVGERHSHPHAELLYAESGTLRVTTDRNSWIVPPYRAAWFPPNCPHQADALSAAELRVLYLLPQACPRNAPQKTCQLQTSSLLRELARRAAMLPAEYDEEGRDGRIMALLLQEIDWTPVGALTMPQLRDSRLLAVERAFTANPGDMRTLEEWAVLAGASPRNLARLFRKEAGMSFRCWREQFRALTAAPRLIAGESVTVLAGQFGYETPGAFAAMFRRVMGMTPSQFISDSGNGGRTSSSS